MHRLHRHLALPIAPRAIVLVVGAAFSISAELLAEQIKLANGDILNVQLVQVTAEQVTFNHPVFGTMTLPRAAVELLPTPPAAAAPTAAVAPEAGAAPAAETAPAATASSPALPPPPPPPPKDWKFKFTFAGSGASGNTENAGIVTKLTGANERERSKTIFDTGYWFNSADGDSNENKFTVGGRHDWLFPGKRYFFFANSRFDYDDFNSWLYRLTGHVGAGYRIFEPPKLALSGLAGIGFIKQWKSIDEDWRPEGLLGIDGKFDIARNHAIVFKSYYYPDLSDFSDFNYRWVNGVYWSWKIDRDNGLSLTAGIDQEYQSQIAAGREHNDIRVYAGVDWEF